MFNPVRASIHVIGGWVPFYIHIYICIVALWLCKQLVAGLWVFHVIRTCPTCMKLHVILSYRCYAAWEDGLEVDSSYEHKMRSNLEEYRCKLCVAGVVLPDPFTVTEGWVGESEMKNWPSLYFSDIADYLKEKTTQSLYHKLCNEYKQGKGYRWEMFTTTPTIFQESVLGMDNWASLVDIQPS